MRYNERMMNRTYKLGIVGSGEMAHAILEGALACGVLSPDEVICSARREESLQKMEALGVQTTLDNESVARLSRYVLIGVRPQDFPAAASSVYGLAGDVISIMAGIRSEKIRALTGAKRVCRVMPNLPCRIGYGACGVDVSAFDEEEGAFLLRLFGAKGKAVSVKEEELDAVTGISGSGPAYVYFFLQSLTRAGVEQGLSEEVSRTLAIQTVIGGAKMAESSSLPFDKLIDSVCSKGGTTIRAVESLQREDFSGLISRAVNACVERSKELSR